MKLLRFGPNGQEKPGLLDPAGRIRDLSSVVADLGPAEISPEGLERLKGVDCSSLPIVDGSPRLGVPVAGTRKFLAIGLNYADHAAESGLAIPPEPVFFTKAVSCLQGAGDAVMIPRGSVAT